MGKNQYVTPHPKGAWQVKGANNKRATARTTTQHDSILIGRSIARNQKSELCVCGKDGRIREKNSYGKDPCPPKG